MDKAKIRLSPKEAELVVNADVILTKNNILHKAKCLLEQLQSEQQQFLQSHEGMIPPEVMVIPPKISKGENYRGLPYLVLDQPRYFQGENHFAIRTMFWWGNFFSITLHVSGVYKDSYENSIASSYPTMKQSGFFICINDEKWEHHFENSNYSSLEKITAEQFKSYIRGKPFIKLAKKISLEKWNDAGDILFESFCEMTRWLKN